MLYGGSVSSQNCGELAGKPHIDVIEATSGRRANMPLPT